MSGLTGLVDTLMADKLVQRTDLVRLPSADVVPGAIAPVAVQAVSNDTRVQSDAARERQFFGEADAAPTARAPLAAAAQELSTAGRAISAVLADIAAEPELPPAARPLLPAAPGPGASSGPLPQALAAAVGESGLFYESHLAALATGAFEIGNLRREPQAQLAARDAQAGEPARSANAHQPAAALARTGSEFIAPEARALVSQQLDLLATGTFAWKGEAWPGVPLQWRIGREEAREQDGAPESGRPWWTTLSLDMPQLGHVVVRLSLAGRGLRANVNADGRAAARLQADAAQLSDALRLTGIELQELGVGPGTAP